MTNSGYQSLEAFVNMPELLSRVDNDRELMTELFAMLQEEFPRHRNALHDAVDRRDREETEKVAHTLKGMLANLAIIRGAELAAGIEAAACAGNLTEILEAFAAFDREEAGILAAVSAFMASGEQ